MLIAGAIELDPNAVALILGFLLLLLVAVVLVCLTGGMLARAVARKRQAFWPGTVAFVMATWFAHHTLRVPDGLVPFVGWLASAGVGRVLRDDPDDSDPSGRC